MAISLVRIDDRLIHGQVVTQWLPAVGAETIAVIDDATARDAFLSTVAKGLAPQGVAVDILTAAEAMAAMRAYAADAKKTLVLVKTPQPLLALAKQGILKEVVVGGMGMREGRSTLYKNISADDGERAALRTLLDAGVKVVCQIVPGEPAVDAATLV